MNEAIAAPRSPTDTEHVRSIALDLILTILTFGFYNLYVQHRQMKAINRMIGQDKYRFWPWFLLSLITLGMYHVYHEYRKSAEIALARGRPDSNEPIVSVVLCLFGFFIVADSIQQSEINKFFGSSAL